MTATDKIGRKSQRYSALFCGLALAACLYLTNRFGELRIIHYWIWAPPLLVTIRVLSFPRLSKESSLSASEPDLKAFLAERDYTETVLNTRVNFLLTASAILGAAATQLPKSSDAALAYGLGACISGLSLLGIDRSCANLNFYLSVLHGHNFKPFMTIKSEKTGWEGLHGAVYISSYVLAVFILLAFVYLASRPQTAALP